MKRVLPLAAGGTGRRWRPTLLAAAILMLNACGTGGPAYDPPGSDVAATVVMTSGLSFSPDTATVRVGDLVEWRNRSLFTHTVTADPAKAADPAHVVLPSGATAFDSGPVQAGQIFRRNFTVPGTYNYVCLPHEGMGMRGTIVVAFHSGSFPLGDG